jgi:hypothetical protein
VWPEQDAGEAEHSEHNNANVTGGPTGDKEEHARPSTMMTARMVGSNAIEKNFCASDNAIMHAPRVFSISNAMPALTMDANLLLADLAIRSNHGRQNRLPPL